MALARELDCTAGAPRCADPANNGERYIFGGNARVEISLDGDTGNFAFCVE